MGSGKPIGLPSIKKILNGGRSLSAELLRKAIQNFPRSKIVSASKGFGN